MADFLSSLAGVSPNSELAAALAGRADILALTEQTRQAVLRPQEPGGLSHGVRVALACRIARLNHDDPLAAVYQQELTDETAALADPSHQGDDPAWQALLAHVDRVSCTPRDASGADIQALQQAGWSDADIVRVSELIAFLSYQIRLLAGLRLLEGVA